MISINGAMMARFGLAILVGALLAPLASAQGKPKQYEDFSGPFYTREHFHTSDIYGLRLGLSSSDAYRVLETKGYTRTFPLSEDAPADYEVRYESADKVVMIGLTFDEVDGRRVLTGFNVTKKFTREEFTDIEARRRELVKDFGVPTYWRKIVYADGRLSDNFHYDRDGKTFDAKYYAGECLRDWKCATLQRQDNCPDLLSRVGGVVVEGSFAFDQLYVYVNDLSPQISALFKNRKFLTRDISDGALCSIPMVH
jgi:hypothetical protein